MSDEVTLTPEDHAILQEELRALGEKGPRTDPRAGGCLVAFAGMVLLVLTPAVGAWVSIPGPAGLAIFILAVALLLGGATLGILGAGFRDREARGGREAALVTLAAWESGDVSRGAALRAAVRYLALAAEEGRAVEGAPPGVLDEEGRGMALLSTISSAMGPGNGPGRSPGSPAPGG